MDIKMIACDLDRTLLRTDITISAYTTQVLAKCRQQGILLAYATARPKVVSAPFADVLRPDVVISDSGALARMGESVIHKVVLPKDIVDEILHILHNRPPVGYITASTDDGLLVNYPIDPNDEGWANWKPIYADFVAGISADMYKISAEIADASLLKEITALPGITYTPYSGENWGTIAAAGVTKWQAVEKVAEHLNINTKQIVAFGDDFSDIEMLQNCGVGVAVTNAIDEVKAVADFICDSNDNDGVARWLEANLCKLR